VKEVEEIIKVCLPSNMLRKRTAWLFSIVETKIELRVRLPRIAEVNRIWEVDYVDVEHVQSP
jgi:hypothetical protein